MKGDKKKNSPTFTLSKSRSVSRDTSSSIRFIFLTPLLHSVTIWAKKKTTTKKPFQRWYQWWSTGGASEWPRATHAGEQSQITSWMAWMAFSRLDTDSDSGSFSFRTFCMTKHQRRLSNKEIQYKTKRFPKSRHRPPGEVSYAWFSGREGQGTTSGSAADTAGRSPASSVNTQSLCFAALSGKKQKTQKQYK